MQGKFSQSHFAALQRTSFSHALNLLTSRAISKETHESAVL